MRKATAIRGKGCSVDPIDRSWAKKAEIVYIYGNHNTGKLNGIPSNQFIRRGRCQILEIGPR